MAQHINTNQLHPAMVNQIPMLSAAGLNLTIMSTGQQHGIPQFTQGQPGMYQIVQQAPGQLQMQNVVHQQHQLNNIHHQQLQQTSYQQIQQTPQITHQQVQQLNNHHQLNNHTAQIQLQQNQQIQQQIQSSGHQENSTTNNQTTTNNTSNNNQQQTTKQTQSKAQSQQKKKPKINKDGVPAPKRATTAYINFTQWYRESIKKTGRAVPKIGEFGKECAAKWNSMTDEEKKPFTEVAARDRDRYRREMEIYRPARDANKPKRPGTAFMLFMVDFRKEVAGKEPEGGVAALAKLGGERWRSMTDEEKKPYVDQQNECKVRYEKSMEEYRQKN